MIKDPITLTLAAFPGQLSEQEKSKFVAFISYNAQKLQVDLEPKTHAGPSNSTSLRVTVDSAVFNERFKDSEELKLIILRNALNVLLRPNKGMFDAYRTWLDETNGLLIPMGRIASRSSPTVRPTSPRPGSWACGSLT